MWLPIFTDVSLLPWVSQQSLLLLGHLVNGLFVAALQWIVLRKRFSRAYWWIVAAGLGYVASWLLYEFVGC
ncbi:MAG: hypothetical protein AAF810_03740 [Cyanobacteria bacterium P01_D01_bin.36]